MERGWDTKRAGVSKLSGGYESGYDAANACRSADSFNILFKETSVLGAITCPLFSLFLLASVSCDIGSSACLQEC